MLDIAIVLSRRATCPKLSVGAVLTDRYNLIVGTGYNGVPRGTPHCTEHPCGGHDRPPGSDMCMAVHAEQNALLVCFDPHIIHTMYCTHAPCLRCVKELMNTSCKHIVYLNPHPIDFRARDLWTSDTKRTWRNLHHGPV